MFCGRAGTECGSHALGLDGASGGDHLGATESQVGADGYFGSVFLAVLLRCHKLVKSRGGDLVLCGVSSVVRELLRITALDTLWAIYDSREEALDALSA